MDTVSNAIALSAVELVAPLVPEGQGQVGQYVKRGLLWSLADEGLDMYFFGQSKLKNGDFIGFGDEVVFNGAVNFAVDASNIAQTLYSQFGQYNPFGERVGVALLSGAIKTTADSVGNLIDRAYPDTPLVYLTHAVSNGKRNIGW